MTVVIGADGAGRTYRLRQLAAQVAGGPPPVSPATTTADLAAHLDEARQRARPVFADDAHRLDAERLRLLTAAGRDGVPVTITRRPTIDRPELADLDEAAAAHGGVEILVPLDGGQIATLIADVTGRPAAPATVAAVLAASAGSPMVAAALAAAPPGTPAPPALVARLQRRLAVLPPSVAELARILALGLDLPDRVTALATGATVDAVASAMRTLRDEGLLAADGERMIPAVATAVLAEMPPAQRRRAHDAVARALIDTGADPVRAATQLSAAQVRNAGAAGIYLTAAERLRLRDPASAIAWYDDAIDAGADPASVSVGRAEAAALLGLPVDLDPPPPSTSSAPMPDAPAVAAAADRVRRLALVRGALAAQDGRARRCAEALLAAGSPGPALAVPALIAIGQPEQARQAASGDGHAPTSVRRLADAVRAVGDPATALPLLIEAAEAVERTPPEVVLPDTPHALGALVAVAAGDTGAAEFLLRRALSAGVGGPVAAERHRALLAWARMRAGRYDSAVAEAQRPATAEQAGRERLLRAALVAGVARRSGDIASLRASWAVAEPLLARQAVDLFQAEPVEELVAAAARLGHGRYVAPVLDALDEIVAGLGRPPAWVTTVGWIRLQVAIAADDAASAERVASDLTVAVADFTVAVGPRQRAQYAAAACWHRVLAGEVVTDQVTAATEELAGAGLPWEASRLAGQAAIRVADAVAARKLLERARELTTALANSAGAAARRGGLSEREIEVARLVLAGRTHREIGAQLFLSPKTVEHHVARIRAKLEVNSRAELIAALRETLGDDPRP